MLRRLSSSGNGKGGVTLDEKAQVTLVQDVKKERRLKSRFRRASKMVGLALRVGNSQGPPRPSKTPNNTTKRQPASGPRQMSGNQRRVRRQAGGNRSLQRSSNFRMKNSLETISDDEEYSGGGFSSGGEFGELSSCGDFSAGEHDSTDYGYGDEDAAQYAYGDYEDYGYSSGGSRRMTRNRYSVVQVNGEEGELSLEDLMMEEVDDVDTQDFHQSFAGLAGLGMSKGLSGYSTSIDSDELMSSRHSSGSVPRESLMIDQTFLASHFDLEDCLKWERVKEWACEFRRSDPRYRVFKFFNDVAQEGAINIDKSGIQEAEVAVSPLLRMFTRASVFTVWRPTSLEAIRKMMLGEAVGKGLDIKGKSAKAGKISGYVPFLQIYLEEHKTRIRTLPKTATMRIFYKNKDQRNQVVENLAAVAEEMLDGFDQAAVVIADPDAEEEDKERAMEKFMWEMPDPEIKCLDEYEENNLYGIEIPERLFWEAYVMRQDIMREKGSEYDTKRPSEPAFQDMNFGALRHAKEGKPRPVVFQYNTKNPMCPLCLLMAYEESGQVKPVVSDFDCFLVGTRGVQYQEPLPNEQLEMLRWCVKNIAGVLDRPKSGDAWTSRWLDVLKEDPKSPNLPDYGYADPKSYSIMGCAVDRLKEDGCVRHGSESFNYYFPQDLDDEFLVIGDDLPGCENLNWKYVDVQGLQEILSLKVDQGYAFPLNPKWILCDQGWKAIYDKLLASQRRYVQDAVGIWFPPDVRQSIESVYAKNPDGFQVDTSCAVPVESCTDGTSAMDLAQQKLNSYVVFQRAKKKMKIYLVLVRLMTKVREERARKAEAIGAEVSQTEVRNAIRKEIVPVRSLVKNQRPSLRLSVSSMKSESQTSTTLVSVSSRSLGKRDSSRFSTSSLSLGNQSPSARFSVSSIFLDDIPAVTEAENSDLSDNEGI